MSEDRASKFDGVWSEVESKKTRRELIEIYDPSVAVEARFEVVITEDDPSFLSHFHYRTIARLLVLLVKVSE